MKSLLVLLALTLISGSAAYYHQSQVDSLKEKHLIQLDAVKAKSEQVKVKCVKLFMQCKSLARQYQGCVERLRSIDNSPRGGRQQ